MNPDDLFVALFALGCFGGLIALPTTWLCGLVWRRRIAAAEDAAGQRGFDQGCEHGRRMERGEVFRDDTTDADWWKGDAR